MAIRHIDVAERRARLGRRHFLAHPARDIEQVAGAMVGLHASDPVSPYLSARARISQITRDEVADALYESRSVLKMLGMRRTMFVMPRDLAAIVGAACARPLAPAERRRLEKMVGVQIADEPAAWVARVCDATTEALERRGEALAAELKEDVPELSEKLRFGEGKEWGGEVGISTRILFLLATEGHIIRGKPRGTWLSSLYRWVPVEGWLGEPLPSLDREESRSELLQRWLRAFGPGTMTDLKWWSGWSLRDTRAALETCKAVEVTLENGTGFLLADDLDPVTPPDPWAALLPGLDPTPMGWKERDWFVGDHVRTLFDRNGNIGPTVWCDGRIVGGWAQTPAGAIVTKLLESVSPAHRKLIEHQRRELQDWLGAERITPRFRSPLDKELAAG